MFSKIGQTLKEIAKSFFFSFLENNHFSSSESLFYIKTTIASLKNNHFDQKTYIFQGKMGKMKQLFSKSKFLG